MGLLGVKTKSPEPTVLPVNHGKERARKQIVRWILFVYWLLILEGVLRKWLFPQLSSELFFVRDPFVLVIYLMALKSGYWPRMRGFFLAAVIIAILALLLVAGQLMDPSSYTTGILAAYGWRNYFFYIPLAFIIGNVFERQDIARLTRHTLIFSIPIAVLVTLQFFSPRSSWINLQAFDGLLGRVRPAGTFSSVQGQALFTASLVALVMAAWIARAKERMAGRVLVMLGTVSALVCIAVSGSRGTIVHAALILLSCIFAGMVTRGGSKFRAWVFPVVIVGVGLVLYPILLPDAHESTMLRWELAQATESQHFAFGIIGRAFYGFVLFLSYIPHTPIIGFGMGIGGNASRVLEGMDVPIRAEDEWSRQIVDLGPVFGVVYILFRIVFFFVLGMRSIKATRRSNDALPVVLFGFIGIVLLFGQVTGNGIVNGYCWMFIGLLLASIRIFGRSKEVASG